MKKKNVKDNKGKKIPQQPNTFVPQNLLNLIREPKYIQCPENLKEKILEYEPEAFPFEIPEEWVEKTEEELNNELLPEEFIMKEKEKEKEKENQKTIERTIEKKLTKLDKKKEKLTKKEKDKTETIETKEENSQKEKEKEKDKEKEKEEEEIIYPLYEDEMHNTLINNLPLSFIKLTKNNFAWLRPSEYVINETIDKEIKRLYPKKKYIQMREDIKMTYEAEKELNKLKESDKNNKDYSEEEDDINALMNDDSETLKRTIYKDFYKFLDNKKKINIVNYTERDETDEEYQTRVNDTIERQKESLAKYKTTKDKKGEKPVVQKPEDFSKIKIYNLQPSDLDVKFLIDREKMCKSFKDKNDFRINYAFISWLTSVFQNILDLNILDCYTNKSIICNIYPQKNGNPIYNPSGHYAIKLYFMGKPRRIDIDDRMPCNIHGEYILPKCEELSEIWPALFIKALMKLNIYKIRHPFYEKNEENVDTSYIYALTGYHTQILKYMSLESEIHDILKNNINDEIYRNKTKFILCLNLLQKKVDGVKKEKYYEEILDIYNKIKENNLIREETLVKENEDINNNNFNNNNKNNKPLVFTQTDKKITLLSKENKSNIKKPENRKSLFTFSPFGGGKGNTGIKFLLTKDNITNSISRGKEIKNQRTGKKQKTISIKGKLFLENQIDILYNFAYSINDYFSNGNFNMSRLKVLDFEDLKRNLKANNVIFKQLSQIEKREFFNRRKVLKAKQLEIKNHRIQEIQKEGKPFLIIKIKSECKNKYKIDSGMTFTEDDIYMAKKCILNNWNFPPPEFFNKYFKKYENNINDIEEETKEKSEKKKKKKISSLDFTRENYIQLIGDEINKYNSTENIKEPLVKSDGGNWINFSDFNFLFNTILILYNPKNLFIGGNISVDDNWLDYKMDCFEPKDDFNVIKLNKENIENKDKIYNCFIIFEPNNDRTLLGKDKIDNYIIFDLLDENNNIISKNITMNKFYSTHIIENLSGNLSYYIIIKGGIYHFGFYLQFYSEAHLIENLSYQNYLSQILDYKICNFKFEHPYIANENFYLLTRLHITPNNSSEENNNEKKDELNLGGLKIIFNIKYPIKHLKKYMKIFIQKEEEEEDNKYHKGKEVFINEQIHLEEGNYLIAIYFQNLPSTIKENSGEINIVYSNKNYIINQIENIDFYEIGDKYKPNKYNIVFKEKIFSCDNIYTSLYIELNQENEKNNEKYNLIYLLYQLGDKENKNIEILDSKFSYNLRGTLIHKFESYNTLLIPNIKLKGGLIVPENKKGPKKDHQIPETIYYPYLLICYINSPNVLNIKNLSWKIKIFSSDNLCFVADSSKEENEQLMKNGWEEQEPGRANLAKISRKRFLFEKMRKEGGEIKNEEDMEILKNIRIRKTTKEKEEEQQNLNTNKGQKKKVGVNNIKIQISNKKEDNKKEEGAPQTKLNFLLNMNKSLPKSTEINIRHKSLYIKNYLKYVYDSRTLRLSTLNDQYLKIINNEKVSTEKSKKIFESIQSFDKIFKTEMSSTFYKSQQPKEEMFNTFYKNDISMRSTEIIGIKDLMKSRDNLKAKFKIRINAENSVKDVLKNYLINGYDYNYMLQIYKDTIGILSKDNNDEIKLLKLLSAKREDDIKNQMKKFSAKDKNNVTKIIEEIEFNQLIISEETMAKLREFIK